MYMKIIPAKKVCFCEINLFRSKFRELQQYKYKVYHTQADHWLTPEKQAPKENIESGWRKTTNYMQGKCDISYC